jgi:hypothetical protein
LEDFRIYVVEADEKTYRGDDGVDISWHPLQGEKLKASMEMVFAYLAETLSPLSTGFEGFQASEIEVGLQISAEGKVGFMGTGASSKGSASITIKFARK